MMNIEILKSENQNLNDMFISHQNKSVELSGSLAVEKQNL